MKLSELIRLLKQYDDNTLIEKVMVTNRDDLRPEHKITGVDFDDQTATVVIIVN